MFEFKWLSSEKWQAAIVKVCQFWDEYLMNADLDQIGRQQEIITECTKVKSPAEQTTTHEADHYDQGQYDTNGSHPPRDGTVSISLDFGGRNINNRPRPLWIWAKSVTNLRRLEDTGRRGLSQVILRSCYPGVGDSGGQKIDYVSGRGPGAGPGSRGLGWRHTRSRGRGCCRGNCRRWSVGCRSLMSENRI